MKKKDWLIALLYVAFIYATLNIVPVPLRFLRSHNLLKLTLSSAYFGTACWLFFQMAGGGEKRWWRYMALIGILALYPLIATQTSSPEEQVHFLEYGLVGVFFARALAGGKNYSWKIWAGAFTLGALAGWLDEVLQGFSPNRHFDVRDIWLNAISVALGLAVKSLYPAKPPKN